MTIMPLPAFFLRQLRRRGLLIALAGLAIVLVIAQVLQAGILSLSLGVLYSLMENSFFFIKKFSGLLLWFNIFLIWRGGKHPAPEEAEPAVCMAGGGGGGQERQPRGGRHLQELRPGAGDDCRRQRLRLRPLRTFGKRVL